MYLNVFSLYYLRTPLGGATNSFLLISSTDRGNISYDTIAITKPRSPSKMTSVSYTVDTCLVCSLTVPDVVSDNCDICMKVLSSKVSAVK